MLVLLDMLFQHLQDLNLYFLLRWLDYSMFVNLNPLLVLLSSFYLIQQKFININIIKNNHMNLTIFQFLVYIGSNTSFSNIHKLAYKFNEYIYSGFIY